MSNKIQTRSFTELLFVVYTFPLFAIVSLLLFFTKEFSLNDYTIVPLVYFIAQIVMQLSLVVILIEQVKRK
jgi:hypothetical protein